MRRKYPTSNTWYKSDVPAIAKAQGSCNLASYFVDADALPGAKTWPRGVMTVAKLPNRHLNCLINWHMLELMTLERRLMSRATSGSCGASKRLRICVTEAMQSVVVVSGGTPVMIAEGAVDTTPSSSIDQVGLLG